jgi:hypothetical protein
MLNIDKFEYATDEDAQNSWFPSIQVVASYSLPNGFNSCYTSNQRNVVKGSSISLSGTRIAIRLKGHPNFDNTITSAFIGERSGSTGNYVSTPKRITFNGVNSGVIPALGYLLSDVVFFVIDKTKDYLIHLYTTNNPAGSGMYGSGDGRYYLDNNAIDQSAIIDISSLGYSHDDSYTVELSDLYVDVPFLNCFSENSIFKQGSYSLKIVALITTALNQTLVRRLFPTWNLSGQKSINFWVRASRTGSNFKLGFHNAGGITTEVTPDIAVADTWQLVTLDISSVVDVDKDAIDSIILTILNADAENIIYLDELTADNVIWPDPSDVLLGIDRGDGVLGTLVAGGGSIKKVLIKK